jgi:hypothetical protein
VFSAGSIRGDQPDRDDDRRRDRGAGVSRNIGGVNQAATTAGAATAEIQQAAGRLARQSVQLSAEVDKFLATVRAA